MKNTVRIADETDYADERQKQRMIARLWKGIYTHEASENAIDISQDSELFVKAVHTEFTRKENDDAGIKRLDKRNQERFQYLHT